MWVAAAVINRWSSRLRLLPRCQLGSAARSPGAKPVQTTIPVALHRSTSCWPWRVTFASQQPRGWIQSAQAVVGRPAAAWGAGVADAGVREAAAWDVGASTGAGADVETVSMEGGAVGVVGLVMKDVVAGGGAAVGASVGVGACAVTTVAPAIGVGGGVGVGSVPILPLKSPPISTVPMAEASDI